MHRDEHGRRCERTEAAAANVPARSRASDTPQSLAPRPGDGVGGTLRRSNGCGHHRRRRRPSADLRRRPRIVESTRWNKKESRETSGSPNRIVRTDRELHRHRSPIERSTDRAVHPRPGDTDGGTRQHHRHPRVPDHLGAAPFGSHHHALDHSHLSPHRRRRDHAAGSPRGYLREMPYVQRRICPIHHRLALLRFLSIHIGADPLQGVQAFGEH